MEGDKLVKQTSSIGEITNSTLGQSLAKQVAITVAFPQIVFPTAVTSIAISCPGSKLL